MAKKSPKGYVSDREYIRRARALKKIGVLPKIGDVRTTGQKASITRLYNKFAWIVKHPEEFKRFNVRDQKKYRKANLPVANGKLFVRKEGFDSIKLGKRNIEYSKADSLGVKTTKKVPIAAPKDIHELVRKLFATKKRNEKVMLRISGRYEFNTAIDDLQDFDNYVAEHLNAFIKERGLDPKLIRVYTVKKENPPKGKSKHAAKGKAPRRH